MDTMTHPLLQAPDTLHLGKTLDVQAILETYLMPELRNNQRRETTVRDICRHVESFVAWWESVKETMDDPRMLPVATIDRRHLTEFRKWLIRRGDSNCNVNRHLATIRQVLRCAERNQIIEHAPSLESLPHYPSASKVYLDNEQITRLWECACKLEWPRRDAQGDPLPYSPAAAWRAALVIWRTYGPRTQELIRLENKYRPIKIGDIYPPGLTPAPDGMCRCNHGWLAYLPQKQERVKRDLLVVPLTPHTASAFALACGDCVDRELPAFNWPLSSTAFRATWREWMIRAEVFPRKSSGVKRVTPKHLRKTATTFINLHRPGMAPLIVGHAADRSAQASVVSSKHYDNAEAGVLETLQTFPQPECFDDLLGDMVAAA